MTQLHTTFGLISSQIISVTSARFSPIITIILSQIIVKRNNHFVPDDMALEFDALTAGGAGVLHPADCFVKTAFVVDADFRNYQRWVLRANAAGTNLHFGGHRVVQMGDFGFRA